MLGASRAQKKRRSGCYPEPAREVGDLVVPQLWSTTMPQINPIFERMIHQATAYAFQHGISCPPLIGVNNWLFAQTRVAEAAATPASRPTTANGAAPGGPVSFDDALIAAVRSSPNGVSLDDLQAILASSKKPKNQIAAAAVRLAKKALLAKRGELWFIKTAARGRPAGKTGTVDKTMPERRTRRARGGKTAGNGATPAGEAQPQAASAG
jgi:hypothetical protein